MTTGDRYLIIGGSNKCGTTSLFRYLGAHPGVTLSTTKEAKFFYRDQHLDRSVLIDNYRRNFPSGKSENTLFVEASPTYLHGGQAIAEHIHDVVPEARLLFLLRDPASRLVSYYKSKFRVLDSHVDDIDFASFVRIGLQACNDQKETLSPRASAFRQELTMARYADFLPAFIDVFGGAQVGVFFFESMLADPRTFIDAVCDFCELDKSAYRDYEFTVENRTRYHRNSTIRMIASRFNERFEANLNRLPLARRALRSMYNLLNAKASEEICIDQDAYDDVVTYYREPNRQLRELLAREYPDKNLPCWLD